MNTGARNRSARPSPSAPPGAPLNGAHHEGPPSMRLPVATGTRAGEPLETESALVSALHSDTLGLDELAERHALTLRQLTDLAQRPDAADLLTRTRRLADERADLIISRARTGAAHRLLGLAHDDDNKETARKACVDLLRMRRPEDHPGTAGATPGASPREIDDDADHAAQAALDADNAGAA